MKDEILNALNMEDILNKYDIKIKRKQFCCPFHSDKNPSAKMYEKTFYCFGCGKTGDLIQFIQYYFNISFKEALQKINEDFNLGLQSNTKINYKRIKQIQRERKAKKEYLRSVENKLKNLCEQKTNCKNKIESLEQKINLNNWQEKAYIISKLQESIYKIDSEIDECFDLLYKIKNS